MRIRKSLGLTVAALTLAALGGGVTTGAQAAAPVKAAAASGPHARAETLTLSQLTDEVLARVRAEYPTVTTLMLASGESPSGPTRDMARVTDWEFVVNNSEPGPVGSVDVRADLDGTVFGVTPHAQRWGGVLPITLPVRLEPGEAYRILAGAGHPDAFQFVSLVKPLVPDAHVQYHFSNTRGGSTGWSVNTDVPHIVRPILGGGLGAPC